LNSTDRVWFNLLHTVYKTGKIVRPRGLECREILGRQSTIDMQSPLLTLTKRNLFTRFAFREASWIIQGRNDLEYVKAVAPNYGNYSDDGFFLRGAYGPRVVDQLPYVMDALRKDMETRQAVIEIWRPSPAPSKDIPCTLSLQWLVRDSLLNCFVTMRSSDTWLGWPYDVFSFSCVSAYLLLLLRAKDQRFLGIELGTLTLTAGSQHVYTEKVPESVPYSAEEVESMLDDNELACKPVYNLMLNEFTSPHQFSKYLEGLSQPGYKRTFADPASLTRLT
jgi:thymidylate synthase